MRITVMGAGNGGQAIAGFCASLGFSVCLYNRNLNHISEILKEYSVKLVGAIETEGQIEIITDNVQVAAKFGDIIFVVTTASAHRDIAEAICPYLRNGQIIILNPGRTFGVLEFDSVLRSRSSLQVYLAEAQTLVYACRKQKEGVINIIGVKEKVLLAGRSMNETDYIIDKLLAIYSCFVPAKNMLQTSLENIGAIFHPSVVLFNAATIERNTPFFFYRDMTPNVASFIQKLDQERLSIGKEYGVDLMPVNDWIVYAYPTTKGNSLCERMRNNPAYHDILGPGSIFTRQLTEDIPTGLIPMSELAHIAGIKTPLIDSLIDISSSLLDIDFRQQGRTFKNLGLSHLSKQGIMNLFV